MAYINAVPEAALEPTYNALIKYVKQYITSGHLRSRFDVFEREAVELGAGIETNIILAATNLQTTAETPKPAEHAVYKPKVVTIISNVKTPAKYAVTIDECRLAKCVGSREKLEEYAAELVQSLYQGWINDKNAGVAAALERLVAAAPVPVQIPLNAGNPSAFAESLLTNVKAAVEDLREGVTGASYNNVEIGDSRIAAEKVVMVMSNATAALLDTYGFSKAFNPEYLETRGVERVTSSRVPENTVIITDSRNIILHKNCEKFVTITNSDGSVNHFYNVAYFIDAAIRSDEDTVGFPIKILQGKEATAA